MQKGVCLILGAADTGKTTLAQALAGQAARDRSIALIDADTGQSHIGPPTTVGWAVIDSPDTDFLQLSADGISFVGDITPIRHLLQLTAAIVRCVRQAARVADLLIIDTPGLVTGPAATALWWTVQRILQPHLLLAVQRHNELAQLLSGLKSFDTKVEMVRCPQHIVPKSPNHRRKYRGEQFRRYFHNSHLYNISLNEVAIQTAYYRDRENMLNRLAALRDAAGTDRAIALIEDWQPDQAAASIRAPDVDINRIHCLVIADVTLDTNTR
jgi:polynucleotide 5'-hydroxyl-kinase GRC3/NOL9